MLDKTTEDNKIYHGDKLRTLFSNPQVIAQILRYSIPEFKGFSVDEVVKALPIQGENSQLDLDQTVESNSKLSNENFRLTINKVEPIKNVRNGAKIGIDVQMSLLYDVDESKKETHHIASRILGQRAEFGELKETYKIWIFIDPMENFEDSFYLNDLMPKIFRPIEVNGEIMFEFLNRGDLKLVLDKDEFLKSERDFVWREIEIYVSEENADESNLFQFIRELVINEHKREEAIETFRKYDWELSDEEAQLMKEGASLLN